VKQFVTKWATVLKTWSVFFVGDTIRVVLGTDTSKKREYNNKQGKITGPFQDKRFPIGIQMGGTTKNLKVKPTCLRLVSNAEHKDISHRVAICVDNSYEAQLVVKNINDFYGRDKKVQALFTNSGTSSTRTARFTATGMVHFAKNQWTRPNNFVADESPIFEGMGATVTYENNSQNSVVTQSIGQYFMMECGAFVKVTEEGKNWNWNWQLKKESDIAKFLRSADFYDVYYQKLKHLTLSEFSTLCFMDGLKRDLATLVQNADDIRNMKQKLIQLHKPSPIKKYDYGKFLTSFNTSGHLKSLPAAGNTMVHLLKVCNGMHDQKFTETMSTFGINV